MKTENNFSLALGDLIPDTLYETHSGEIVKFSRSVLGMLLFYNSANRAVFMDSKFILPLKPYNPILK